MEEWKIVEGFSRYEVSNTGIIREVESLREIPQQFNNNYYCVNLYRDDGVKVLGKVHRIVALTFIPNVEGVHNVDHRWDRKNNSVDNLFWRPKKVKPEKITLPEEILTYLGTEYALTEFSIKFKIDKATLKYRVKHGWTSIECLTGIKHFRGQGYEDGFYWYPTQAEYQKATINKRKREADQVRQQKESKKKATYETYLQSQLDYRKFGVGNFVNYPIAGIVGRKQLKVYRVWSGMLSRCYSPKNISYNRYGEKGVYVCEEWLEFQNFAAWYNKQYMEDAWHLDKDILSGSTACYSPETCVVIPSVLNSLLATMQDQQRNLPMGVIQSKNKGVYSCQYILDGVRHAKQFTDVYEAALHYKMNKELEIKRVVEKFKEKLPVKVYQFFMNYTIDIREEFKPLI